MPGDSLDSPFVLLLALGIAAPAFAAAPSRIDLSKLDQGMPGPLDIVDVERILK